MKKLNYQVHLSFLAGTAFVAVLTGCVLPGQSSGSASPVTTTSDGSSSSPSPSPTASPSPTPTYGMNCTTTQGASSLTTTPVAYLTSINGSSINSVKVNLYANGQGPSSTAGTVTLTAYTCGSPTAIGSSVASTTNSTGLTGNSAAKTFTFSSPVTIPTNCASGEYPIAFKFTWPGSDFGGRAIYMDVSLTSSSCFMYQSLSSTQLYDTTTGVSAHSFVGVINANP